MTATILYKCVLIACSSILAQLTRMRCKEFKTNNVVILSYTLALVVGVGMPIILFSIIGAVEVSVSICFIIVCLFVDVIIYICFFFCFISSIDYSLFHGESVSSPL